MEFEKIGFDENSTKPVKFARDSQSRSEQLFPGTGQLSTLLALFIGAANAIMLSIWPYDILSNVVVHYAR